MTLSKITLPKVELPFDIPVLLHPLTDHFLIAIPVVILLLELMNLMMKKKAVSGVSFFLILLTIMAALAAYFTGLVDGKEAYPGLAEEAKTALTNHKLLGTYVMLASGVVLLFKLISMMTGSKIIKSLYLLVLIVFILALFKQGKEGGELVYTHGLNVELVKELKDDLSDAEEELEEAEEKLKDAVSVPTVQKEIDAPAVLEASKVEAKSPAPSAAPVEKIPEETTAIETAGDTQEENTQAPVQPEASSSSVEESVKVLESE